MLKTRFFIATFLFGLMVLGAGVACGQNYPNKPLRIVTANPGGSSDFLARLVAPGLSDLLGQPTIVDNRSGTVIGAIVARAMPDGYTLLLVGGSFWIAPFLHKMPYDPIRDFSPTTLAVTAPTILVVHPSLPANSVKELIALAKARPGALNYAEPSIGSPTHLAAELFKSMAGVNIVHIHYDASGPAFNDLFSGEVQVMFPIASSVMPHLKSGRLRGLAVTSAEPSTLAPGLPTMAASGLPGYEVTSIQGVFAPARTSASIINRLNQDIVRVLNKPDVKQKLLNAGSEVVGSSPEQLGSYVRSDMARMGKLIKDVGLRAD